LSHLELYSLGFSRVAFVITRAVKDPGCFKRHFFPRRNQNELLFIRCLGIQLKGFIADSDANAARQRMPIVINYLSPRPSVNHCLVTFDTWPFFAFVSGYGDGAKLDASTV
jgi:hypothetical protein